MWEVGQGYAGEVVFASEVCAKVPNVQICPRTFVHDCSSHVLIHEGKNAGHMLAYLFLIASTGDWVV